MILDYLYVVGLVVLFVIAALIGVLGIAMIFWGGREGVLETRPCDINPDRKPD